MKLFAFSGLGADRRVFEFLNIDAELIYVDWIDPLVNESLNSYSKRIAHKLPLHKHEKFGFLGVSFGGMIASELSKKFKPNLVILISSAETKKDLRVIYRIYGKTKLNRLIPSALHHPPMFIMDYLFGAKNKTLLHQILKDTDPHFAKWCIDALINWKNETKVATPLLKLHGTQDKLIPISKDSNIVAIENGGHFMIVDKANEISLLINEHLKKLNLDT